ncbi:MAG: hypothetical protein GXO15_01405, partial [Crenarchaeota archaeon]|nr:hypothetical protein [Thermoproteota archaeon]
PRSAREAMRPRPLGETPLAGLVEPVESRHTVPTWGALVRGGGGLVYYSSDTALTRRVEDAVSAADVSIVEATLPAGAYGAAEATGHMTVDQALRLAARLRPGGLLVLTHLSVESLSSLRQAGGSGAAGRGVVVASDGLELLV